MFIKWLFQNKGCLKYIHIIERVLVVELTFSTLAIYWNIHHGLEPENYFSACRNIMWIMATMFLYINWGLLVHQLCHYTSDFPSAGLLLIFWILSKYSNFSALASFSADLPPGVGAHRLLCMRITAQSVPPEVHCTKIKIETNGALLWEWDRALNISLRQSLIELIETF